jgi:hypothetical protein
MASVSPQFRIRKTAAAYGAITTTAAADAKSSATATNASALKSSNLWEFVFIRSYLFGHDANRL